jgi:hypothetical protein
MEELQEEDSSSSLVIDENLGPAAEPREILVLRITPEIGMKVAKKVKVKTFLAQKVSVNVAHLTFAKVKKFRPPADKEQLERVKNKTIEIFKSNPQKGARKSTPPKSESVKKEKPTPVKKEKKEKVEKVKTEKVVVKRKKGKTIKEKPSEDQEEDEKPAKRSRRKKNRYRYNEVFTSDSETDDEELVEVPPPKDANVATVIN